MSFECKELSITENADFGCTITFSGSENPGLDDGEWIFDLMNSNEKYLLIQRSYPEDFDEKDFYSIETSESDAILGDLDKIIIILSNYKIKIQWSGDEVEIGLNLQDKELKKLEKTFKRSFKDKVIMIN